MKNTVTTNIVKVLLAFFLFANIMGCGEMLDNPTIDKDTGEDITLLIVDFNFFNTRMDYKFVDAETNMLITKPAKMWFTGKHANDIVNFAGEKNAQYNTSQGQMELTVDPNLNISASSPLEYAVNVEIEGYNTYIQGIQVNAEGKKTFELHLTKETSGEETTLTGEEDGDSFVFSIAPETKSASTAEKMHVLSYRIKKSDIIRFKDFYGEFIFEDEEALMKAYNVDKTNFIKLSIKERPNKPIRTDRLFVGSTSQMVLFNELESGQISKLIIGERKVTDLNGGKITQDASYTGETIPDAFGFATKAIDGWILGNTTIEHTSFDFMFTLVSASLKGLCATGSSITFESSTVSSFSIDAVFKNNKDMVIKTTNFKGKFPETFILENVPSESATVTFLNNNPSFKPIADLSIADLCTGDNTIQVEATNGYKQYQVTLLATCKSNKSVAVAPTYSGQYRINKQSEIWQGLDMEGGKVDILAKPNEDYEIRLLWDDQYEGASFRTEFDAEGNYLGISSSKVSSEKIGDRIRIKIEHEFDQDICDDMNW